MPDPPHTQPNPRAEPAGTGQLPAVSLRCSPLSQGCCSPALPGEIGRPAGTPWGDLGHATALCICVTQKSGSVTAKAPSASLHLRTRGRHSESLSLFPLPRGQHLSEMGSTAPVCVAGGQRPSPEPRSVLQSRDAAAGRAVGQGWSDQGRGCSRPLPPSPDPELRVCSCASQKRPEQTPAGLPCDHLALSLPRMTTVPQGKQPRPFPAEGSGRDKAKRCGPVAQRGNAPGHTARSPGPSESRAAVHWVVLLRRAQDVVPPVGGRS